MRGINMHKHLSEKSYKTEAVKIFEPNINKQSSKLEKFFELIPRVYIEKMILAALEHLIVHYAVIEILQYFQIKAIYLSLIDTGLMAILITHLVSLSVGAIIYTTYRIYVVFNSRKVEKPDKD
jgi:hypothetical protein